MPTAEPQEYVPTWDPPPVRRSQATLLKPGCIATRSGFSLSFREYGTRPAPEASIRPIIYIHGLGGSREEYFGRTSLTLDRTAPSRWDVSEVHQRSLASLRNFGQWDRIHSSRKQQPTDQLPLDKLQELEEDAVYVISVSRRGYGGSAVLPDDPLVTLSEETKDDNPSSGESHTVGASSSSIAAADGDAAPHSPADTRSKSDWDWDALTGYEIFATQIVDMLDVLGIQGGVSVMGWSSGGPYAMALARFIGGAPHLVDRAQSRQTVAGAKPGEVANPSGSRYPFFVQTLHLVASDPPWSQTPKWLHSKAHYQGLVFWIVRNRPAVLRAFWRLTHLLLVRPVLRFLFILHRLAGAQSSHVPLETGKVCRPPRNFLQRLLWFPSLQLWERRLRAAFQQGGVGILSDMHTERVHWGFHPEEIQGVPVTLFHGKSDLLVDYHSSTWLARQLKTGAPELRLRLFPGDTHNIMEFRWTQLLTDVLQQQFRWRSATGSPVPLRKEKP